MSDDAGTQGAFGSADDATTKAISEMDDALFPDEGGDGAWPSAPTEPTGDGDGDSAQSTAGADDTGSEGAGAQDPPTGEDGDDSQSTAGADDTPADDQTGGTDDPPALDEFGQALSEEQQALYGALSEEQQAFVRAQAEAAGADPFAEVRERNKDLLEGKEMPEIVQDYNRLLAMQRQFVTNPRELVRRVLAQHNMPPEAAMPGWQPGQPAPEQQQQQQAEPEKKDDPLAQAKELLADEDMRTELGEKGVALMQAMLAQNEALSQQITEQGQAIEGQRGLAEQDRRATIERAWDEFATRTDDEGNPRNPLLAREDVRQRMQLLAQSMPAFQQGGQPSADAFQEAYDSTVGSFSNYRDEMIERMVQKRVAEQANPQQQDKGGDQQTQQQQQTQTKPAAPAPKPKAGAPPKNPGAASSAEDGGFTVNGIRVPGHLRGNTDGMIAHIVDSQMGGGA